MWRASSVPVCSVLLRVAECRAGAVRCGRRGSAVGPGTTCQDQRRDVMLWRADGQRMEQARLELRGAHLPAVGEAVLVCLPSR